MGLSLDKQPTHVSRYASSKPPRYTGGMGLHDRDYYRRELTRRDGRRSVVFRYWIGGWRTARFVN